GDRCRIEGGRGARWHPARAERYGLSRTARHGGRDGRGPALALDQRETGRVRADREVIGWWRRGDGQADRGAVRRACSGAGDRQAVRARWGRPRADRERGASAGRDRGWAEGRG